MIECYQWIQHYLLIHPFFSPLLFIFFHILFASCFLPCSPLSVIAGLLWGNWGGLAIASSAAFLSSCCTFGLSRIFLKHKIYQFLILRYPRTEWFLASAKKHEGKFIASVQLNPIVPGSTLGYLFGLTHIDFAVYARYLVLCMLPPQLLLVGAGSSLFQVINAEKMPWFSIAAVVFIFAIYFVYRIYNNKINKWSNVDVKPKKV